MNKHLIRLAVIAALIFNVSVLAEDRPATQVMVLDFELKDLTIYEANQDEVDRTATIKPMLEQALAPLGKYRITVFDPATQQQADPGHGYLYDHPVLAAELGQAEDADWVLVGRVHKPSYLFLYLKMHVIDVSNSRLAAALTVEVKGLDDKFVKKGVHRLAEQINDVINHYSELPRRWTITD